jgi:hypothetical protein
MTPVFEMTVKEVLPVKTAEDAVAVYLKLEENRWGSYIQYS